MPEVECAAILFDMDGVLVDSRAVVERVWRRWAAANGLDSDSILKTAQGRRTVDTLRQIAPTLDVESELQWLDEAELSDLDGIRPIPGAIDLISAVPPSRWAVVTSAGRELARLRLEAAGLPSPACLVSADEVPEGKPAPHGFLSAADALGIAPEGCLVVEDSPAGIRAARAAQMQVLGLTTTHAADELPPTDVVVRNLSLVTVREGAGELVLRIEP